MRQIGGCILCQRGETASYTKILRDARHGSRFAQSEASRRPDDTCAHRAEPTPSFALRGVHVHPSIIRETDVNIYKYPRTRHVEGSRLQVGDLADDKPIKDFDGKTLVVEEKLDGANSAVSFDADGTLLLQSRGHDLTGGGRERHFALFKTWAAAHAYGLQAVLGPRFVMYGEWMYAKHTVFYDRLPHYFMEFDVLDRESDRFLSTAARRALLTGLPVMPVPVVHEGRVTSVEQLNEMVRPSPYKSANWRDALTVAADRSGSRADMVDQQIEDSDLAEGLYLKLEDADHVQDRYKYVRADFLQAIEAADGHWQDRPILPNTLADGVDVFAPVRGVDGAYDAETG